MIVCKKLRDLDVTEPSAPRRPTHVSAASGLVRAGAYLYVVADDELHLGMFDMRGNAPGHLVRLFEGTLPDARPERKRHKPDLEALTFLPPVPGFPFGALLALSSASTAQRRRGALVALDSKDRPANVQSLDITPLLSSLSERFAQFNIEGATVANGMLCLFQRGNRTHPENAVIGFMLDTALAALRGETSQALRPIAIRTVDLGTSGANPFAFTDAAALRTGETIFTAIVEDTPNAYDDGACIASVAGCLDAQHRIVWLRPFDRPYKVEGIDARVEDGRLELLLVTDVDDAVVPAALLSATTPP
jgi:hypothetical protein